MSILIPFLIIIVLAVGYAALLYYLRHRGNVNADGEKLARKISTRRLPKSAKIVPYMEPVLLNFQQALKIALPDKYIIEANVPLEKLFEVSQRRDLNMKGQYADFVVFTPTWLPVLVIDLFDMSIINLDRVNKIKNVSKEILRNSGLPVLDYRANDNYNIDDLRRTIANLLNPLRVDS